MKQEKISALQLFYVMVGFENGNALIYGLGIWREIGSLVGFSFC